MAIGAQGRTGVFRTRNLCAVAEYRNAWGIALNYKVGNTPSAAVLLKGLLVLVIVVASFTAALLFKSGGVPSLTATTTAVAAGDFRFAYPSKWHRMPKSDLPASAGTSVKGSVVAGLCPPASKGCTTNGPGSDLDVSYVLFEEGQVFPSVTTLESDFDAAFPAGFKDFHKINAQVLPTADGARYLRYEFSFTRKGVVYQEIVAAYRAEENSVVVVATGPQKEFSAHRAEVIGIMDGGHQA